MLGESFYSCFSRLKRPSLSTPPSMASSATTTTSAVASSSSSSLSSSGAVVFKNFKNFNSLYDAISDSETAITLTLSASAPACSSFSSSCDCLGDDNGGLPASPPSELELSTAIASRRLLLASPGPSNSIVDSAVVTVGVGKGLAVQTYSPDPYQEFRRSMVEMVAALGLDAAEHRAHLHELLFCYLALNPEHVHKHIMGAFADILLSLSTSATGEAVEAGIRRSPPESDRN